MRLWSEFSDFLKMRSFFSDFIQGGSVVSVLVRDLSLSLDN